MTSSGKPDLRAMERLAVRSWPARETRDIAGWLWRSTSGGSIRANSVSTLEFSGGNVDTAIDEAEALYRARGEPVRFNISDIVAPAGLDQRLAARGYELADPCTTLWKPLQGDRPAPPDVEVLDAAPSDWLDVYLGAISASRRPVAASIVARVPAPKAFFACHRDGQVVSTGLCVIGGPLAVVMCMASRAATRRTGGARAVLAAIEHFAGHCGARALFLQTGADNTAAQALYASVGYRLAGRYHVRMKP
jgi:ribosomal protein S18 acetylase RimI-like enzyme